MGLSPQLVHLRPLPSLHHIDVQGLVSAHVCPEDGEVHDVPGLDGVYQSEALIRNEPDNTREEGQSPTNQTLLVYSELLGLSDD